METGKRKSRFSYFSSNTINDDNNYNVDKGDDDMEEEDLTTIIKRKIKKNNNKLQIKSITSSQSLSDMNNIPLINQEIDNIEINGISAFKSIDSDNINIIDNNQTTGLKNKGVKKDRGDYDGKISDFINENYRIMSCLGKGVFATVYRCVKVNNDVNNNINGDVNNNTNGDVNNIVESFAVKVVRSAKNAMDIGEKEIKVLKLLNKYDPHNYFNIIHLNSNFIFEGHHCLVLENMNMSLKKYTYNKYFKGVPITYIKEISKQILSGLEFIHRMGYIHCDIKPDNILINDITREIKICDFGSCVRIDDINSSESFYIVARFYRAPEVILGLNKTSLIDIWSVGVTISEMYRSSVLFNGNNNNEILWNIIQLIGPPSKNIMEKSRLSKCNYFDIVDFTHKSNSNNNNNNNNNNSSSNNNKSVIIESEYVYLLSIKKKNYNTNIDTNIDIYDNNDIKTQGMSHIQVMMLPKISKSIQILNENDCKNNNIQLLNLLLLKLLAFDSSKRNSAKIALKNKFFFFLIIISVKFISIIFLYCVIHKIIQL
jgi:serine/threonine protein kinase